MGSSELVGKTLGDFEVEELVGKGSMAQVFKARQISLRRPVALKILEEGLFTPHDNIKRFVREAEAMARLEYGRMLWRKPAMRERLMNHWTDPRHPWSDRFQSTYESLVREAIEKSQDEISDTELDRSLRERGYSLRAVAREIPPVFGAFW